MKEVLYEYRWRVWPIDFYGKINVHGPFYNLIFNWRPFNEQGIILSFSKYRLHKTNVLFSRPNLQRLG